MVLNFFGLVCQSSWQFNVPTLLDTNNKYTRFYISCVYTIAVLNKIKPPYNVNSLSQTQAILSLNESNKLKEEVAVLISLRALLQEELPKLSYVEKVFPTDSNFILIRVDDANVRYQQLLSQGIVVRNRTNDPLCENCLRITIGTPEETDKLLTILKEL